MSEREEYIAKNIVDAAFIVHKNLGPGLLERVYEICFCHEKLVICELKAVEETVGPARGRPKACLGSTNSKPFKINR